MLKQTHTLALVIPDITNPFFPEIARGVEDTASLLGYSIFLCNTNWDAEKEKLYIRTLQEKRVDGIILHPVYKAGLPQIQLTTIEQPKYQMGRYAIELLMKALEDKADEETKRIILEPKLKVRKTTREVS